MFDSLKCDIFTAISFAILNFFCNKHQSHLAKENLKEGQSKPLLCIKVHFVIGL
jgi:hypothetical protein